MCFIYYKYILVSHILIFDNIMSSNTTSDKKLKKVVHVHDEVATLNTMPYSSYNLELSLEKLMYCAMTVIHKYEMDKNMAFNPTDKIEITADNFFNLVYSGEFEGNLSSAQLKDKAAKMLSLRRTMLNAYNRFDASPIMLVPKADSDLPVKVPMINSLHYDNVKKTFSIEFHAAFYDFFYKLNAQDKKASFNKHELKQILKMNSYYSLRLYRIFNSEYWRTQEITLTYDTLRKIFQKENQYRLHGHIKSRLIVPAIEEINELTDLHVEYECIKTVGGAYDAVTFRFARNKKYISHKMVKALEKMKVDYLSEGKIWSDDLSHFKVEDREKHFTAPTKLSPKQIGFLISSPVFMNDYGHFLGNFDLATGKVIMKALLENSLDKLNEFRKIDLDWYFALSYANQDGNEEDLDEEDLDENDDQ